MIRIYEGFLERLYTFVRRTEHVYENAWSLLRLLKQADTSLSQVSLQEDLGGLHYAVMDREWLVEIRN